MTSAPLAAHLTILIVAKVLLLGCLWLAFVRPDGVLVDPAAMAARAGMRVPPIPPPAGEDRE